jgi:hypothetical protein
MKFMITYKYVNLSVGTCIMIEHFDVGFSMSGEVPRLVGGMNVSISCYRLDTMTDTGTRTHVNVCTPL